MNEWYFITLLIVRDLFVRTWWVYPEGIDGLFIIKAAFFFLSIHSL